LKETALASEATFSGVQNVATPRMPPRSTSHRPEFARLVKSWVVVLSVVFPFAIVPCFKKTKTLFEFFDVLLSVFVQLLDLAGDFTLRVVASVRFHLWNAPYRTR